MKKLLFIFAIILASCEETPREREVCEVIDKGYNVSSHFNPFHNDNFSVETDYFITFRNVKTGKIHVYQCRDGKEYYSYQKGKCYYMN